MTTSNGSTMKWKEQLINLFINKKIKIKRDAKSENTSFGIHLAIFTEPFLSLLFEGKKTMESRFSINKIRPYQNVSEGDIIFIKKSGGPVCGYFVAGKVFYFLNSKKNIDEIKVKYSNQICTGYVNRFWEERKNSKYITLIEITDLIQLNPINIEKKDRTAWVIIRNADSSSQLLV